jgi:sec-independent protein translocase protein TatB
MFDIGFWELALIGVIALLVVGPERLPAMARSAGLWVGRIRRYISHVKDDIEREIRAEELREMMKESSQIESLDAELSETRDTLQAVEKELEEANATLGRDDKPEADEPEKEESQSASDKAAGALGERLTGPSAPAPGAGAESSGTAREDGSEKNERRSG